MAEFSTWHADLGQTGTDRRLSGDEGRPTGCTALLAVSVSEHRAFFGDAIDVRRAVTHDAVTVGTDIVPADIVAPNNEDVRFISLSHFNLFLLVLQFPV
jgi:hypothetical protein